MDHLLNQTVSIYTTSSHDRYGRETVGSATDYSARVQVGTKTRLLANGEVITIEAICYVLSTTTVVTGDKLTYDSVNYRVHGIYKPIDDSGNVHHIKLELVKWQL